MIYDIDSNRYCLYLRPDRSDEAPLEGLATSQAKLARAWGTWEAVTRVSAAAASGAGSARRVLGGLR